MIPTIVVEVIDKDKALFYLSKSTGNRSINRRSVDTLKKLIQEGEWHYQISPIQFSEDGALIDGHHRLTAISECEKSVPVMLMQNVPDKARRFIDTGKPRRFSDTLAYNGFKNTVYTEACARLLLALQFGIKTVRVITFKDLDDALTKYSKIISFPKRGDNGAAYFQMPLAISHLVLGLDMDIVEQVQTGYNIAANSIADKIRKNILLCRKKPQYERMDLIMNTLEMAYRYQNNLPFSRFNPSNEIRKIIIESIKQFNSSEKQNDYNDKN